MYLCKCLYRWKYMKCCKFQCTLYYKCLYKCCHIQIDSYLYIRQYIQNYTRLCILRYNQSIPSLQNWHMYLYNL